MKLHTSLLQYKITIFNRSEETEENTPMGEENKIIAALSESLIVLGKCLP